MNVEERKEALALVRRLIGLIGDNPDREGLEETPERVVRSWEELYSGYADKASNHAKVFTSQYHHMVLLRGVDYFSTCEHHMLPFFGKASIAYIPRDGRVLGVSKLARLVNVASRKLQIQERMTEEIAAAIEEAVKPEGVLVLVEGMHLCMVARGVAQQHAKMVTSKVTGTFNTQPATRAEALALLNGGHHE